MQYFQVIFLLQPLPGKSLCEKLVCRQIQLLLSFGYVSPAFAAKWETADNRLAHSYSTVDILVSTVLPNYKLFQTFKFYLQAYWQIYLDFPIIASFTYVLSLLLIGCQGNVYCSHADLWNVIKTTD